MDPQARRAPPRLMIITDDVAPRRHARSVLGTLARAFDAIVVDGAGAVAVVVRARGASLDTVAGLCRATQQVVGPAGVAVVVHGHASLVASLGLQGVHLPWAMSEHGLGSTRALLPPGALLGVSAHPRHDGDLCAIDGADYATWSPVFSPSSKHDPREPLGVAALAGHPTPVIALGGVDHRSAAACLAHGAVGVAVLGAVLGAADPALALRQLLDATGIRSHRQRTRRSPASPSRATRGSTLGSTLGSTPPSSPACP